MVWVLSGDAPVADVNEYAVLSTMADKADSDGCGTWLSKETIAARAHVSEETVKRCWRNMTKRGLIAKGDQNLVRHYRADRRPVVWDLLIPYAWFSNIDRINAERERLGRPPLTPADRPPIAPPPAKKQRADKGKPRAKKTPPSDQGTDPRGNSETPRDETSPDAHGGTTSRRRGNYKSSAGELQDPQCSKSNQSVDTGNERGSVRPSVSVEDAPARETDGRTDASGSKEGQADGRPTAGGRNPAADAAPGNGSSGEAAPGTADQKSDPGAVAGPETTPGMEVLTRVGRARPELAVAGKVLSDQARELDMRIADSEAAGEPWRLSDLVTILSAPLDGPIRRSAGAVIAARIRNLPRTPRTAMLPAQVNGEEQDRAAVACRDRLPSSTLAAERDVAEAITRRVRGECPECGGDSPGGEVCGRCQGWPECDEGCGRVVRGGGTCETCQYIAHHAAIAAEAREDGTCPGHGGEECGRPVMTLGLCARCRIKAEDAKRAADAEWEAAVARAVAAVEEGEKAERDPAPL